MTLMLISVEKDTNQENQYLPFFSILTDGYLVLFFFNQLFLKTEV